MYTVEVQCRVGSPVIDDDWCGCVVHMRTTCLMSELMISEQWRTDGCIRGGVWIHSSICDAHVQFYQLHPSTLHIVSCLRYNSYHIAYSSSMSPITQQDGSTEYKRQVHKLSTSRLRTLATQMSYRLDQGMGRCTYHVGVEDDGCHSVMDYQAVSESAWVLESIGTLHRCDVP